MAEIRTDTNQMSKYNFELSKNGMTMKDGNSSFTWGADLLEKLAAAGDPVGKKYQSLKSENKSVIKSSDLSSKTASVSDKVTGFISKYGNKQKSTTDKIDNLQKTSKSYTTGMEAVEKSLSGGPNTVADEKTNKMLSSLPNIGEPPKIDFGKTWNNNDTNFFSKSKNTSVSKTNGSETIKKMNSEASNQAALNALVRNYKDAGMSDNQIKELLKSADSNQKNNQNNAPKSAMENYAFELTNNGNMLMKDKDSKQIWSADLLNKLAAVGDPVGLKYYELLNKQNTIPSSSKNASSANQKSNGQSPSNTSGGSTKKNTGDKTVNSQKTGKSYTTGNETIEKSQSENSRTVVDEKINKMLSGLFSVSELTQTDFGKTWNNNDTNFFSKSNNASVNKTNGSEAIKKMNSESSNQVALNALVRNYKDAGMSDNQIKELLKSADSNQKNNQNNAPKSAMENYAFELTNNGNMLMKDKDSKQIWSADLLNKLAAVGDPVGLKYYELLNKQDAIPSSSKNVSSANQKSNGQSSSNTSGGSTKKNTTSTPLSNDTINNVSNYVNDLIAFGLSEGKLKKAIDDNNNAIKEKRELIKSGKYSGEKLAQLKSELQILGEVSKQLSQSYGTVTASDYASDKVVSDYISNNPQITKKSKKQIKTEITKNQKVLKDNSATASEKSTATKNILALRGILSSTDSTIFNEETNKKIDDVAKNFITKDIPDFISKGLSSKDIEEIIGSLDTEFSKNITSISQSDLTDEEIAQALLSNQINSKEKSDLLVIQKKLKNYEKWLEGSQNEVSYIFKDGITKEEKNKYVNDNKKQIDDLRKKIKSGKLSEAEVAICRRQIDTLSEYNSLVEINNNEEKKAAIASDTSLEYYQDLQAIDKCYENINKYKYEKAKASVGNAQEFYQNLILSEENKAKKLEEKCNINSDVNIKNNAVKGYNEAKEKLLNLEKNKNEYTDDEYQKEYNAILSTMNDHSQQYTEIENKDTWKDLIYANNSRKDLEIKLFAATNPEAKKQLENLIGITKNKIIEASEKLNLGNEYIINSNSTRVNELNSENKKLSSELKNYQKEYISCSYIPAERKEYLERKIDEVTNKISINNQIIDQRNIESNKTKNSNLLEYAKYYQNRADEIKKNSTGTTETESEVSKLEGAATFYNELSKMDPSNGLENNANELFNKNFSNITSDMSSKKISYYDGGVGAYSSLLSEIYDSDLKNLSENEIANINERQERVKQRVIDYYNKAHLPEIANINERQERVKQRLIDYYNIIHSPENEMETQETTVDNRSDIEKFISGVGATICQTGMTLWHGVENAAESAVDFAVTVGTGITSLGTSAIDLVNGNFGGANSITQNLYNDLDSFVATDWIGNAADSIYDTDFGKWVNDNSVYKRDGIVAGITRGVGEVAGKVAFASVLASGAGTVGSSATTATTGTLESNSLNITKSLSSTKVMQPIVAGITGYSQGMEDALNDGATHTGAVAFASANALWEAAQWKIGGKINELTSSSLANSTSIAKNLGILGASVAADTVDSAVEGFVQPGMKMIYNGKTFEQSFKDNGGWETVGAQAALGGIMSALGSTKDFVSSNKKILSTSVIDDIGKVSGNQSSIITASKVANPEWIASAFYKYLETNLTNDIELSSKAMNEGLLHFTSLENATKIIESGEIRPTKDLPFLYDHNKAYMFAGIPSYSQMAINMKGILSTVMTAVRIKPTDSQLSKLKFRFMDDFAVSHKGKFYFDTNSADIAYFGITRDIDGNLEYREITKEIADNYDEILAKKGIKIKKINDGKQNYTIVDGTSSLDGINKQLDISRYSILKTMLAVDDVANKVISKVESIGKKIIAKMEQGITSTGLKDSTNYDKVIGNTMDSSIKSAKKPNINFDEVSESLKTISVDSALKILANGNGKYGVDQGLLTDLRAKNPTTYLEIKNKLVNEYKFNNVDAERFLSIVDSKGACNYACEANVFVSYFKNSPEQFEKIFGFPLYKQNQNGELYLNDAELLVDLYYWGNAKSDEAELFKIDSNGKTIFNDEAIKYKQDGSIKSVHQRGGGIIQELMNDYLKSKGSSITFDVDNLYTGKIDSKTLSIDKIKNDLVDRINSGEQVSMVTSANKNAIIYTDIDTGKKYPITGGHWTKIMDYTDDGVIVSSWGKRCLVKFEDLPKIDAFDFFSVKINDKIN